MRPRASAARQKALRILGIRGIPGCHGGFESFAQDLAPFLAARGWKVSVYCQVDSGPAREENWQGVGLVCLPVTTRGALGTMEFDWHSTRHAVASREPVLVLGYNTAMLSSLYRLRGIPNLLNMDGLEWRRQKHNPAERAWLLLNEWIGSRVADHVIADHPSIHSRYANWAGVRGLSTVPYGSRSVHSAERSLIEPFGLLPDGYTLVIARPEPENYILEIVRAYSARPRSRPLVVLGSYTRRVRYQRHVLDAARSDTMFPGAIYDRSTVDALRYFATLYVHGHRVGGTNPSLVEALGAGNAVLAHDNVFNRWVCGSAGAFFADEADLASSFDRLLEDHGARELPHLRAAARLRHASTFDLTRRLEEYEEVLAATLGVDTSVAASPRSDVA
jgi:hypothetical protein